MYQAGRDNPPIFTLDPELAHGTYHALLTEIVTGSKLLIPLTVSKEGEAVQQRTVDGETQVVLQRGLFAFTNIERRDLFIRSCNKAYSLAFDEVDSSVCIAVTVPGLISTKTATQTGRVTTPVTATASQSKPAKKGKTK